MINLVKVLKDMGAEPGLDFIAITGTQTDFEVIWTSSALFTNEQIKNHIDLLKPEPQWDEALSSIHKGLRSQSLSCPFCQIRHWSDLSPDLKIVNLEFMLAFNQPLNDRTQAVQSAFVNIWNILTEEQRNQLNKAVIDEWRDNHYLSIVMPWE